MSFKITSFSKNFFTVITLVLLFLVLCPEDYRRHQNREKVAKGKLRKESCKRKVVKGKLLAKCFKTKLAFQKLQVKSYFPKVDDNKNGLLEDY